MTDDYTTLDVDLGEALGQAVDDHFGSDEEAAEFVQMVLRSEVDVEGTADELEAHIENTQEEIEELESEQRRVRRELRSKQDYLYELRRELATIAPDRLPEWAGMSKGERRDTVKMAIEELENVSSDEGVPIENLTSQVVDDYGADVTDVEHYLDKLKQMGEVYEPRTDHLRAT